jgi:hypothetical protein
MWGRLQETAADGAAPQGNQHSRKPTPGGGVLVLDRVFVLLSMLLCLQRAGTATRAVCAHEQWEWWDSI